MALQKNQIVTLELTGFSAQGGAVGRWEGEAVFVPLGAPGDLARVKIVKAAKTHAFGKPLEILRPSPARVEPDCPCYAQCGGCCWRHVTYEEELRIKEQRVRDALERVGGFRGLPVRPILPWRSRDGYRNKALLPLAQDAQGRLQMGFYAPNSHRVADCRHCRLHPESFRRAMEAFRAWAAVYGDGVYNEESHRGKMRRLYLRRGERTGEVMACVVVNGNGLKHEAELAEALREAVPELQSLIINSNRERTNVALGPKNRTVWGTDAIRDVLCGLEFEISPLSFFQVNPGQAEKLYQLAAEYAGLEGRGLLLDLYCGTGTIGLSMAKSAGRVIGIETVPQAVEDARRNARRNGITNAEFLCADAAAGAAELARRGERPEVVVLDPPRKGCGRALVEAAAAMKPERVVYISCDPATLARDLRSFVELGYEPKEVQPVDMFPGTGHVETVVMLSHKKPDSVINVKVEFGEGEGKVPLDNIAKRAEAYKPKERVTYKMIKEYIEAKYGFKVHTAYIAEVKRELGLPMYDAPNAVEELKQPRKHPTAEKAEAIKEALKHFEVI